MLPKRISKQIIPARSGGGVTEASEEDIVPEEAEAPEENAASEAEETPEEDAALSAGMDEGEDTLRESELLFSDASSLPAGKGTEKNPYLITNEEELAMISNASDAHWKLAGDVILEKEFVSLPEFSGTLDGDGYRISGTIAAVPHKDSLYGIPYYETNTGLIKENTGTIKNLCLEVEISSSSYGLQGGFLVYNNHGIIENCGISGALHIIERDLDYYSFAAGGAVYANEGTIRNCYAKISMDGSCRPGPGTEVKVGGFLYRLGENGTVENCYSVSSSFGKNGGCFLMSDDGDGTLKSCYYDGDTITDAYMYTDGSGYYARHTDTMKWQPNYKDWDFVNVWAVDAAVNDGYPYLRCQRSAEPQGSLPSTLTGRGTEKDPYLIASEEQLEMVGGASDAYWKLACDIILEKEFVQIPEFSGTLDGDGYRISGTILAPRYQPFNCTHPVGFIKVNKGTIKNLCLEAETTVENFGMYGGLLADENHGLIENCSITGTIHIVENSRWYDDYHFNIGGAVYENQGTIQNCYAKVFFDGDYLTSGQGVGIGGFLGKLGENGAVENCYSISSCSSDNYRTFTNKMGCFLAHDGYKEQGTIKNCYYDGDIAVKGEYMSVDGPGYYARHTSTMKWQTNYEGWDFDNVWAIDPAANDGYPYLRSQRSAIIKHQDIKLDRKEIYLVEEAEPFQLHASIIPANATNQNITWSSSDKYVASVDSINGTVTPLAEGEATITATTEEGGLTADCKVNVIPADDKTPYVAEVIVSPDQAELKPGEECQFRAEVKGISSPGTGVQWSVSGNESAATAITSDGCLKAAENESAAELTVTAVSVADSSKKTSVKVTVLQEAVDPAQPYAYEVLADGTVKITKYKGTDKQIEVPDKIDGKEVSVIGESAFQGLENITSVKLPESITKIESGAFAWCTGLASVNLPAKITEIADTLFYSCAALTTVKLPEGVTSIGEYAFYGCTVLNNIYLPASLQTVGAYAFYGCTGLKQISYGGSEAQWKQISSGSDNECLKEAGITYNSEAPEPEDPAPGEEDKDPASYEYEALSGDTVKITGYKGTASAISIPDKIDGKSVTVIGENAFQGLESLVSVKLPESIVEIENGAFANCTGLKSVKLPAKIIKIPETAFYRCAALKTVNLPDGVTKIEAHAFYGCAVLNNIYLPASLQTVGEFAFYECSGLKKVLYGGNEGQWKQIDIDIENECLKGAEIAYGSKAPEPEDPDNPDNPDDPDNPGGEDGEGEVLPEDVPYIPGPQFTEGFWGVTTEKEYIYTRKAIKPEVHVYYRENLGDNSVDRMAEEGLDYKLSYKNNVNASRTYEAAGGQSYAVVTGKNIYKGKTGRISFVISLAPLKNVLSGDVAVVSNGKEQKKLPALSYNGKKLS